MMVTATMMGTALLRLLRRLAALVELPEVGVSGALHRVLHGPGARVVGRHRQVPVAELVTGLRFKVRDPRRAVSSLGSCRSSIPTNYAVNRGVRRTAAMNCHVPRAPALRRQRLEA